MLKGHKEGCILYHPETNRETVKETTLDAHRCRPEMFPGRVKRVKKKKKSKQKGRVQKRNDESQTVESTIWTR